MNLGLKTCLESHTFLTHNQKSERTWCVFFSPLLSIPEPGLTLLTLFHAYSQLAGRVCFFLVDGQLAGRVSVSFCVFMVGVRCLLPRQTASQC